MHSLFLLTQPNSGRVWAAMHDDWPTIQSSMTGIACPVTCPKERSHTLNAEVFVSRHHSFSTTSTLTLGAIHGGQAVAFLSSHKNWILKDVRPVGMAASQQPTPAHWPAGWTLFC